MVIGYILKNKIIKHKNIMSNERRKKWTEFINDEMYQQYFTLI